MRISHFHDSGRLEWKCERLCFGRDASYTLNEIWWKANQQAITIWVCPGPPQFIYACPRAWCTHKHIIRLSSRLDELDMRRYAVRCRALSCAVFLLGAFYSFWIRDWELSSIIPFKHYIPLHLYGPLPYLVLLCLTRRVAHVYIWKNDDDDE